MKPPSVVHFGEEPEVLASTTEENSVVFETTGFSVYGIVDAPEPQGIKMVNELSELEDGTAFYLSYGGLQNYTINELNNKNAFKETTNYNSASAWYFESAGENSFYIYTIIDENKSVYCLTTTKQLSSVFRIQTKPLLKSLRQQKANST